MVARSSSLWETRTGQLNGVGSKHRAAEWVAGRSSVGWIKPRATTYQSAWVRRAQLGVIGFDFGMVQTQVTAQGWLRASAH